jgi:signal transduction histidine kinase
VQPKRTAPFELVRQGVVMKMLTKTHQKPSTIDDPRVSAPAAETPILDVHAPCRLALVDLSGDIVAVNSDWMALAEETDTPSHSVGPGANYLEVCRQASTVSADARTALRGINAVLKQRSSYFSMDYRCPTPNGPVYFHMIVTPILYGRSRAVIAHRQITERDGSQEQNAELMQEFALRLIRAQEEERQRISQELHDDLGSRIALIALSLRQAMKHGFDDLPKVFDQVSDLARVLRNLSHGLHSPVLKHVGLAAALKSLQEQFQEAHAIRMNLEIAPHLMRLPQATELCLFRVAQEALQNVSKHSGASFVSVRLDSTHNEVRLTVADAGRGFRSGTVRENGLGLLSMEARALSIGGHLKVVSAPGAGTNIRLTVPLRGQAADD